MSEETVTLPKGELYEMLDAADEMIGFCAGRMPAARYRAVANAVWVLANRAAGNDRIADLLLEELREARRLYFADDQSSFSTPTDTIEDLKRSRA